MFCCNYIYYTWKRAEKSNVFDVKLLLNANICNLLERANLEY